MKQYNILYHAINGTGFGHVKRAQNIISFLYDCVNIGDIHLATSCNQCIDQNDFAVHKLSYGISEVPYQNYASKTSQELGEVIDKNDIDCIFHDTFFIVDFLIERRDIWHFLVYRLTSREHFLEIKQYFPYFKKIFIPHSQEEFFDLIGEKEAQEFEDIFVFTGYIFPEGKASQKKERKDSLLISPGLGGDYDQTKEFLSYILDIVSHISPKKDIILYPGKHRERLEKELDFSLASRVCDFSSEYAEDFLAAGVFIGRGGYNTVGECIAQNQKSLLFGAQRKDESQQKRIEFFSEKYGFLKVGNYIKEQDIDTLNNLFQDTKTKFHKDGFQNGGYILQEKMNEIFQRSSVMVFYPSYFQKSHIFVRDELAELSKYLNVNIYTFNPFFRETSFSHNNYRVFYDARFDTLYQPDVYPYLYRYSETQKRVYAIWISHMTQEIEKYAYTTCITEFLSDGMFLSLFRKTVPICKFLTFCRGKDIYTSFQKFPSSLQQKIFQSHDVLYVMDYSMKQKLIDMGCPEEKIEIFYVGKYIEKYTFSPQESSSFSIVIGGRFVPKKGIVETLAFLEHIMIRGNVDISKIYLLGEREDEYKDYEKIIIQKIQTSPKLSQKVIRCGFLSQEDYLKTITQYAHIFIGHFQKGEDGDEDGIPNILLENMLVGNLVFSTLSGGIGDILLDRKTGYILSSKLENDLQKVEQILGEREYHHILENARELIIEKFDIKRQIRILLKNVR